MVQVALDPKRHAYRADLADARLRDHVQADRYVAGRRRQCGTELTGVRVTPTDESEQTSQLLWGETFTVFDEEDGWCWGQCNYDGYVGYVASADLDDEIMAPTHRVWALRTFVFPEPSYARPPSMALPMNARVAVGGERDGYRALGDAGWILNKHVLRFDDFEPDPVATALRFLETPYMWGGRSIAGMDCSGLVQVALQASGIFAPRDSYMQAAEIGEAIDVSTDLANLERGDLVFFPSHVGFADGAGGYVHASGHDGMVTVHRLRDVVERERRLRNNTITAIRRPPPL